MATLKDKKGRPWCYGLDSYGPGPAEVECVEHQTCQSVTLDLDSQKQQKSKSIENSVNLEWNEEFFFHVTSLCNSGLIVPHTSYVIGGVSHRRCAIYTSRCKEQAKIKILCTSSVCSPS